MTRIYFPGDVAAGGQCAIGGEQAHYLVRVLRVAPGERVTLFDGRGGECEATITSVAKHAVGLVAGAFTRIDRESPLKVCVAQGLSSGERMDLTVQKAVELGAVRIQPLATERSVVHLDGQRALKRIAHWQAVAEAACAQSGRNVVPQIAPVMSLTAWLGALAGEERARLMLAPAAPLRLHDLDRPQCPVWLLCGPEGGLAESEQQAAMHAGFRAVRLGPRVLRTETAALAGLAAMQALWGDF